MRAKRPGIQALLARERKEAPGAPAPEEPGTLEWRAQVVRQGLRAVREQRPPGLDELVQEPPLP